MGYCWDRSEKFKGFMIYGWEYHRFRIGGNIEFNNMRQNYPVIEKLS